MPDQPGTFRSLTDLRRLFRTQEWIGPTFCPLFVPFYYLLLIRDGQHWYYIAGFVQVLGFVLACGSLAFALNTFCDLSQDLTAGKRFALSAWPRKRALVLLAMLAGLAMLILASLAPYSVWLPALGIIILALSAAYSVVPLRLKERPLLGPLTIATAQFAVPQLMVFALFELWSGETVLFTALFFLAGLRAILFHQIVDYGNDLQASVVTFVTTFGIARTWHILNRILVPLEIGVLAGTLILLSRAAPGLLVYAAIIALLNLAWARLAPAASVVTPRSHTILFEFYWFFWPVFLLVQGAVRHWSFLVLLAVHGFLTLSFWAPYRAGLRVVLNRLR